MNDEVKEGVFPENAAISENGNEKFGASELTLLNMIVEMIVEKVMEDEGQ